MSHNQGIRLFIGQPIIFLKRSKCYDFTYLYKVTIFSTGKDEQKKKNLVNIAGFHLFNGPSSSDFELREPPWLGLFSGSQAKDGLGSPLRKSRELTYPNRV